MNDGADSTLWLIPARGGSKGIPDKNIKPFRGVSLVGRAVVQAKECAAPQDIVFVTTDSPKIKEEAEKFGISIQFLRPDSLATDTSSTYDAIMHAINKFEEEGKFFKRIVLLQPTSPLRNTEDIKNALKLWEDELDMVVSVAEARANPYYNAFEVGKSGYLKVSKGEGNITRRQDAPKVWEYNGAVYIMNVDSLKKSHYLKFKKTIPSPMDSERSIDIDSPLDWIIAEHLYDALYPAENQ